MSKRKRKFLSFRKKQKKKNKHTNPNFKSLNSKPISFYRYNNKKRRFLTFLDLPEVVTSYLMNAKKKIYDNIIYKYYSIRKLQQFKT